jgi:hypothetical protein
LQNITFLKAGIYCVHIYVSGKLIPVETVLEIEERVIKENGGGGEFKYDIFDTF